jgi:hypothetical protein
MMIEPGYPFERRQFDGLARFDMIAKIHTGKGAILVQKIRFYKRAKLSSLGIDLDEITLKGEGEVHVVAGLLSALWELSSPSWMIF